MIGNKGLSIIKCVINGRVFEGGAEDCFFAMASSHRAELKKVGLWDKEDEEKFIERYYTKGEG